MDFGKAFTFMFEDPDWLRKLAIGTVVMLIGVVLTPVLIGIIPLIIVTGYTVDVVRNVRRGERHPMPEWEDWGGFLSRGFKLVIATLVWALPIIILYIPFFFAAILMDNNNGGGMEAIGGIIMVCGGCLMAIWGIFLALMTPAIYVRVATHDRIGAAFEIGEMWAWTRAHLGDVIVAVLLLIVAGLLGGIIAMLGLVALLVGVIVTIPFASLWQMLVGAHLYGQIGRDRAVDVVPPYSPAPYNPPAPLEPYAAPAGVGPEPVAPVVEPPAYVPPADEPSTTDDPPRG